MSGTVLAQFIPFIFAPILSRIYSPTDFGRLALYLSIIQILGAIANGRYELAIVLPESNRKAKYLTLLSVLISFALSILSFFIIFLFSDQLSILLGDKSIKKWLFLIPISIIFIGVFNALNYYNIRHKRFNNIAKAQINRSLFGNILQLILRYISTNGGLIIGQVFSHLLGNIKLINIFPYKTIRINKLTYTGIVAVSKEYIDFPKFTLWGIFMNVLSTNMTNIIISKWYNLSSVGFYSIAFKYLGVPSGVIGNSIGQVYFQKISENKHNEEFVLKIFKETLLKLFIIGGGIFLITFFIVEDLFIVYLGDQWSIAGTYSKILIPLFFIRFLVSPLSMTNVALERQKVSLFCHSVILLTHIITFIIGYYCRYNLESFIKSLSLNLSLSYTFLLFVIFLVVKRKI